MFSLLFVSNFSIQLTFTYLKHFKTFLKIKFIFLKMSDFKCNFCPRTFSKRSALSNYMNVCALTSGKDEQLFANNPAQVRNYSKQIKQHQNENFDINEYKSDSEFSAKKISFKDIKFRKSSKVVKDIQFNSNSNLDSTLASPLHVSNTDELASDFDNVI